MYCTRFCPVLRRANYPLPRGFSPRLMLHFVLFLYDALKVALFGDIYKKFVHFHTYLCSFWTFMLLFTS